MGRLLNEFRDEHRDWVRQARTGDRGAFDRLMRAEFRAVYALSFRFAGNHEDAEDLAQECFVRAWGALGSLRDEQALSPWLAQITLRLARDRFRALGRRAPTQVLDAETPSRSMTPGEAVGGRELAIGLRRALERLPHRLRAPLLLRVIEGREYDEVASMTGVRPATARTQVMQARKLLLRWLGPMFEGRRPC